MTKPEQPTFLRFGPAGGSLECNIFTRGKGTLSITGSELPRGFHAQVEPGGRLCVHIDPLPVGVVDGGGVRSGELTVGRGRRSQSIVLIQSSGDNARRRVNPPSMIASRNRGAIEVASSDPWRAEIHR